MIRIILVVIVAALTASPAWTQTICPDGESVLQCVPDGPSSCIPSDVSSGESFHDLCPSGQVSMTIAPKAKTNLDAAWQACLHHSNGKNVGGTYSFDRGFEDDCNLVQFKFKNHDDLKIIQRGLADPDGTPK